MKRWRNSLAVLAVFGIAAGLWGCASSQEDTVTVIDGDFAEMKFFTQVARILIEEKTDLKVKVQDSMASSLAFEQIKDGKMDIYMSYDGSFNRLSGKRPIGSAGRDDLV